MTENKKENYLMQLGYLMRFANRINNTHPELVNDTVRSAIEKAKEIIKNNSEPDLEEENYILKLLRLKTNSR